MHSCVDFSRAAVDGRSVVVSALLYDPLRFSGENRGTRDGPKSVPQDPQKQQKPREWWSYFDTQLRLTYFHLVGGSQSTICRGSKNMC